jgi:DNA-binding MarR family transcriptional regulator
MVGEVTQFGEPVGQSLMTTKATQTGSDGQALEEADYKALGDFRRAIREFLEFSAEGAQAHGMTSQQHQALLAIKTHQGEEAMSVGELADCLLIKNHSAIGLVSRLAERGFARRLESDLDRRRALVALTPAGAQALQAISVRNLGQLKRATRILEGILRTTRRISRATKPDGQ